MLFIWQWMFYCWFNHENIKTLLYGHFSDLWKCFFTIFSSCYSSIVVIFCTSIHSIPLKKFNHNVEIHIHSITKKNRSDKIHIQTLLNPHSLPGENCVCDNFMHDINCRESTIKIKLFSNFNTLRFLNTFLWTIRHH